MDIFPYIIGLGLTVAALYWSLVNNRRPPGTPTVGLFRYRETLDPAQPGYGQKGRRQRSLPVPVSPASRRLVQGSLAEADRALGSTGESLRAPRR